MEYIKHACTENGNICDFCSEQAKPNITRVPRPFPGDNGDFLPLEQKPMTKMAK